MTTSTVFMQAGQDAAIKLGLIADNMENCPPFNTALIFSI
jgi:hypothetical protein